MSIYGNPIMLGASGGSTGIPLLTSAEWNALSKAQKQSYGLVAVQDTNTGFDQGELYYGANYIGIVEAEMVPTDSWNASSNSTYTYTFASTTLSSQPTVYCLAAMLQNGTNPAWDASDNLKPALRSDTAGNGSYALCCGPMAPNTFASTYSGGNNWNNSEIVCFCLSEEVGVNVKELFFEQGQTGTYTYTYQANEEEALLLIAMRGGNNGGSHTITGLTQKSHVTSSGARFNDVYYGAVSSGDEVSISIPYEGGYGDNGALFVALLGLT